MLKIEKYKEKKSNKNNKVSFVLETLLQRGFYDK
jgi:hypothetical protein